MDEQMVAVYAARSALCRKHGDDISADYWADEAQALSDRLERDRDPWGGANLAQCGEPTCGCSRLRESIARLEGRGHG